RGDRVLLREVDLTLSPGDRLAVVGENGRGKTTLLEALSGDLAPDAGTIERHGRLGLVRQELQMDAAGHRTVGGLLDELLARPLHALQELDDAAAALGEDTGAVAARRYDDALAVASAIDAWGAPRRLQAAPEGVGALTDRDRPLATMPVGQRYRVRLAGVLAARDELLLLDEPTNHLDARGLAHLTRALQEHPGAAALVSHDRTLLAETATCFLDLDPTSDGIPLRARGGIEDWQHARRRHRIAWEDAHRAQQQEHRRLHRRAEEARPRLATGRRPDKGTGKQRRQSRAPGAGRARHGRTHQRDAHPHAAPSPPPLLRADGVRVDRGPGEPARLAETSLRLEGGDRLLVVGPNGAGKTTLLQVLAGVLTPSAGSVRRLSGARPKLLAQEDGADGAAAHGSPG